MKQMTNECLDCVEEYRERIRNKDQARRSEAMRCENGKPSPSCLKACVFWLLWEPETWQSCSLRFLLADRR